MAEEMDLADAWERCHQLRREGMGVAPPPEFAEPDLEQQWLMPQPTPADVGLAANESPCASPEEPVTAPNGYTAPDPFDWRWFQFDEYSGLDSAKALINGGDFSNLANRITIAHLDTGYKEGHRVLPLYLDTTLARSFVKGDPDPNSAVDPGIGSNAGHGTGTLSLLAGATFDGSSWGGTSGWVGGAPFARVAPVRVATSVVEFANSSIARGIRYAIDAGAHILSMSMGGIPSQTWVDVVNDAYEAGLIMVTAAGNNFGPGPVRVPKFIVWPARFHRVLAACGVMSNGASWTDFGDPKLMAGCYGPTSKMETAMACYTPNVPWAEYACPDMVRFDGTGTSAATPQVAAAAACYVQNHLDALMVYQGAERWKRVETVRKAMFDSAAKRDQTHLGQGIVRASAAMQVPPSDGTQLVQQPRDSVKVPFLGPIFGAIFGVAPDSTAVAMLHLEAAQLLAADPGVQTVLADTGADPDTEISTADRNRLIAAMLESPSASPTLKRALTQGATGTTPPGNSAQLSSQAKASLTGPAISEGVAVPAPLFRSLRVFAFDPALGLRTDTQSLMETTLRVPWEAGLKLGPTGEYIEVVDVDPSTGACYAPVNLNDTHLLAGNGLQPSEALPQFHQQMVYAVAMTTIGCFERALGRRALWSAYTPEQQHDQPFRRYYVQRLRIYPHALREANAYYSPAKKALLFGYFQANPVNAGDNLPGGIVFNCLSHDVVAHETTHALLDGLHPYYLFRTNADMAAFHEAFADIVAIFQHFSIPEALHFAIAQTRGNLNVNSVLSDLAQQFGQATTGSRALRSGLGQPATAADYANATEPHARGAVLLAAVFEAFVNLYMARSADLLRLATNGTGVLPAGDISEGLVDRLAREAAATALRVLTACIRALDYCPPVDLTFGDYLRALITADLDLEPEVGLNARVAFIAAFRARGIYPSGVRSLSEESLRWQPPLYTLPRKRLATLFQRLNLQWNTVADRRRAFESSEANGLEFWKFLHGLPQKDAVQLGEDLGVYLVATDDTPPQIKKNTNGPVVEVHSVRPARRVGSDGHQITDLVVEMVQQYIDTDPATQQATSYRGGCTMLIDLENERIRYAIRKRVGNVARVEQMKAFRAAATNGDSPYFLADTFQEPFAMIHRSY
jgi:hypothetical protein